MIEILQEVTDWGKLKVNNGIYHVNSSGKLVAFQPNEHAPVQHLKVPSTQFSKARRKFVKIGERAEEMPSHIIEVTGSKGNTYYVDTEKGTCTCPGFTYRGNCKHVKEYC
tara:strand:+ start:978 stop:1307 length:330 start_codon:yes stop_codon:yes gene_type:complete